MIVSSKIDSFLPPAASLWYLSPQCYLKHTQHEAGKFKQPHCVLTTVMNVGPSVVSRSDCGKSSPVAKWPKNTLEAHVVNRADNEPERKLATGELATIVSVISRKFVKQICPSRQDDEKMRRKLEGVATETNQRQNVENIKILPPGVLNCCTGFFFFGIL